MNPRGDPDDRLAFGDAALRLNPRALPLQADPAAGATGAGQLGRSEPVPERRVAFALDAVSLTEAERAALRSAPGARLGPYLPPSLRSPAFRARELAFSIDLGALRELATRDELARLLLATQALLDRPPARPALMGILNVTPDSFSDGGRHFAVEDALRRAEQLVEQGATWLDVGGESTRPGAAPVTEVEELRRVLPVLEGLRTRGLAGPGRGARLSIDTRKAVVAQAALERGAELVNDVSAGTYEPRLLEVVAACSEASICLMHMRGDPETMQQGPRYDDPVAEIAAWLRERTAGCLKLGIPPSRIVLDPGIGFGKRLVDNLELIRRLVELRSLGRPLLVGVSRKSFIAGLQPAAAAGEARTTTGEDRLGGTAAAVARCVGGGAEILRVHDVDVMASAAAVAFALHRPVLDLQDAPPAPRERP